MEAALFLIPVTLGETEHRKVLPDYNRDIIGQLRYFIVENVRTARRFLKKSDPLTAIDRLTFYELSKYTPPENISDYLLPLSRGESVGVISEAGCPAVADPGADVVAMAQCRGYKVVPLVGPSSILLALMASGFNGQSFAFHGYLPVNPAERAAQIRTLESRIYSESQTQLFIETPYRNGKLIEALVRTFRATTKLCIAAGLTCDDAIVRTRPVKEWVTRLPDLDKKPAIFLLYK